MLPEDPIQAVSHSDPYPYYDELRRTRPFDYDARLGCWLATSAEAAAHVLSSDACAVRPPSDPVPRALRGRATGALFGAWIRMRDDPARAELRQLLAARLERLSEARVAELAIEQLRDVAALPGLDAVLRGVPVRCVVALLGVPRAQLGEALDATHHLLRALAEGADAQQLDAGDNAAHTLFELATAALRCEIPAPSEALIANAVGLLVQTCEATGAWIGNALVAWARADGRACDVGLLVDRVLRDDPPVQNTRRFVTRDVRLAGRTLSAGERILIVLAAAQRDPSATEFAFGHGVHACPGAQQARAIVRATVSELIASGIPVRDVLERLAYCRSPNIRMPRFDRSEGEA